MKKLSFLLAIFLCLGSVLASCSIDAPPLASTSASTSDTTTPAQTTPSPDPGITPPPANPDAFELSQASVVRPIGVSETVLSATLALRDAYLKLTSTTLPLISDEEDALSYEILIGETNRPESIAAKEQLPAGERFAYAIVRIGDLRCDLGFLQYDPSGVALDPFSVRFLLQWR